MELPFSNVAGKFSKKFAKKIPGTKKSTHFWSSGVSVVLHPKILKFPAMHFNTRFICTSKKVGLVVVWMLRLALLIIKKKNIFTMS